jgi:DNA polymerase II small subunit/DNA polymerase delta subunit B
MELTKVVSKLGMTVDEATEALKSLKRGCRPMVAGKVIISTNSFAFGYISDEHMGHKQFQRKLFEYAVKYFKREKPDFILNPGDHLEGMSGRPGHVYELNRIGFAQQFKYAKQLYGELDTFDHYGIDGNHDEWFFKKNDNGVIVGEELQASLKNYHNLGQDDGNLVVGNIKIKLFHAGDGTAYATSYKLQKLIESFSGGMKPHILLSGHYHKALYMFCRGVHGFECGTLCGQTSWMRAKKIAAHMGFGFVKVYTNRRGVERLIHEFVPWYEV